LVRASLC